MLLNRIQISEQNKYAFRILRYIYPFKQLCFDILKHVCWLLSSLYGEHYKLLFCLFQDKAHCPFQIKTGACRFGLRCSRLHFYPDKSCTLLIKNMYNGPGLAFEQDEGLEVCKWGLQMLQISWLEILWLFLFFLLQLSLTSSIIHDQISN